MTATNTRINDRLAAAYIRRFNELNLSEAHIAFERAKLIAEIRAHFPNGASGDLQTRAWIAENLGVTGSTLRALMDSTRALKFLTTSSAWTKVGGHRGAKFLTSLTPSERRKVLAKVDETTDRLGRGVSPSTVRNIALRMGIRSRSPLGRPTQTQTESKVETLRLFITSLYSNFEGLPEIPEDVREAMTPTLLAEIRRAASQ